MVQSCGSGDAGEASVAAAGGIEMEVVLGIVRKGGEVLEDVVSNSAVGWESE